MNKPIVIFGAGDIAEVAHYYFKHDSDQDVVAFTVDQEFLDKKELFGLPVIPFEKILDIYPPADFDVFICNQLHKTQYSPDGEIPHSQEAWLPNCQLR